MDERADHYGCDLSLYHKMYGQYLLSMYVARRRLDVSLGNWSRIESDWPWPRRAAQIEIEVGMEWSSWTGVGPSLELSRFGAQVQDVQLSYMDGYPISMKSPLFSPLEALMKLQTIKISKCQALSPRHSQPQSLTLIVAPCPIYPKSILMQCKSQIPTEEDRGHWHRQIKYNRAAAGRPQMSQGVWQAFWTMANTQSLELEQ